MSEQLKCIVQELNKPPFNKSYNLISFDSLAPLQLLQVLNDVLAEIDPKQTLDIREESPDQTAVRIFQLLRVLKYKPPQEENFDPSAFRAGLIQGDKPVIYPILEWLLQKVPELKKRAYLARYLVKVEIPPPIMQEDQIMELYQQYDELIDQFKDIHKQAETLKNSGFNTTEIRRDISNMEEEKEQLIKRIERLKRKVESHPNATSMMNVAKNLRVERDREKKLGMQKQEQSTLIQHCDQRAKRLQQQLKDIRQASAGASAETLLKKLEEETRANSYIVKDKLPKDITAKKKTLQQLQKVVAEPAMGHDDLDDLHNKIEEVNSEVNQLVEKKMMSNEPVDDKLSLFRQQAAIIVHKKDAAIEQLRECRDDYNKTCAELEEKTDMAKNTDGGEVLKGEDFKRYVNKLRSKSTVYKKKRQELAELRAEKGVVSRTEEILTQKDEDINMQLSVVERKKGVDGYRQTQDNLEKVSTMKSELDAMKGSTLEDISHMVTRLTSSIAEKKSALAPTIKELRPLRQRCQELKGDHEVRKSEYERQAAGYESNRAHLEQEVRGYREECSAEESRYHYLQCMIQMNQIQQHKVSEEMKSYMSSDAMEKKKTYREMYGKKIQEQENMGKNLREKQKAVRENHGPGMKQMKIWKDFERIMECKRNCFEQTGAIGGGAAFIEQPAAYQEEDRLVL